MRAAARCAATSLNADPKATGRQIKKKLWLPRQRSQSRRQCRTPFNNGVGVGAGSARHRRLRSAALLAAWRGRIGQLCQQTLIEPLTRRASTCPLMPLLPAASIVFTVNRTAVVRLQQLDAHGGGGRNSTMPLAPMRRPLSLTAKRHCRFHHLRNRGRFQLCRAAVTVVNVSYPVDEEDDEDEKSNVHVLTTQSQPVVNFLWLNRLPPVLEDSLEPVVCELRTAYLSGSVAWRSSHVVAVSLLDATSDYAGDPSSGSRLAAAARPSKCLRRRRPPKQQLQRQPLSHASRRSFLSEGRWARCGNTFGADFDQGRDDKTASAFWQPLPRVAQLNEDAIGDCEGSKESVETAFAPGSQSSRDSAVSSLFGCQTSEIGKRGAARNVKENMEYDEDKKVSSEDEAFSDFSVGEVTFSPSHPHLLHSQPSNMYGNLAATVECTDFTRASFARTRNSSRSAGRRFLRRQQTGHRY